MLEWNHNAHYHGLLLRQVPTRCHLVLDAGCGAGEFASLLARHSGSVDAVDRSEPMLEEARRRTPGNVNCALLDVLADPLPHGDYDAIFSISSLHHMPLEEALSVFANALKPGGTLAAIALPRRDLPRELFIELGAAIAHRAIGALPCVRMPVVLRPPLTTRHVARRAAAVLPGVRVRRLLFWRYLLVWEKPKDVRSPRGSNSA